jgi:hypothetical protein
MMFGEFRQQLIPASAALLLLFQAKTYSIEITRTTCDQTGLVHLLNRPSSENQHCGAIPAVGEENRPPMRRGARVSMPATATGVGD